MADWDRVFTKEEAETILNGFVSLDTLRGCGLVGGARGYWGENLLESIRNFVKAKQSGLRFLDQEATHEGKGIPMDGIHLHPEGPKGAQVEDIPSITQFHPRGNKGGGVENPRERFDRLQSRKAG